MHTHYAAPAQGVFLPTGLVKDQQLSYFDLGILSTLLASDSNENVGYRELAKRGMNEAMIRQSFDRLEHHGLFHRFEYVCAGKKLSASMATNYPLSTDQAKKILAAKISVKSNGFIPEL